MFGMKTSDLFRRAKQIADLEGSDFITWNEAINLINESNVALYEKLINIGENAYVKSFHAKDNSVTLPEDFWQLKGVYLWNNGNLRPINRRAGNNGVNHLSYELRNGFLNLFGNPDDVIVEYYEKPKKLTYPNSDTQITLSTTYTWADCCGHCFLRRDGNNSYWITDFDGVKTSTVKINLPTSDYAFITDSWVFTVLNQTVSLYNIAANNYGTFENSVPVVNESGELFIIHDGYLNEIYYDSSDSEYKLNPLQEFSYDVENAVYACCDDDMADFYLMAETGTGNNVTHNGRSVSGRISAKKIIYADEKCYFLNRYDIMGAVEDNTALTIKSGTGKNIGFVGINEATGYGFVSYRYGNFYVSSYCNDTPLDYPNSLYFQLISYILAIAFRSKQGADISLLSQQLAMIEQTFEDTLGSDAYQFPRMGNVYN